MGALCKRLVQWAVAGVFTLVIALGMCLSRFLLPVNVSERLKIPLSGLTSWQLQSGITDNHFNDFLGETIADRHPVILFWTQYWGEELLPDSWLYQEAEQSLLDCPVNNCQFTSNRSLVYESAAVIFHIRDLRANRPPPVMRFSHQYYVFYLLESPQYTEYDVHSLEYFFNLTFTYRLDSDVVANTYFRNFHPKHWTAKSHFAETWREKSKFAAIFLSHCGATSLRDVYLEELSLYLPVDRYGNCGTLKCSTKTSAHCDERLASYKFYLAFENSICKDYVTEKIHRAFNYGTIPVVYGGANYTGLFPLNSFINALDFNSPKKLAEYLLFVGDNKSEYERYFQWRYEEVSVPKGFHRHNLSWCKLCKILNAKTKLQQTVFRLDDWWNGREQNMCSVPTVKTVDRNQSWVQNPIFQ